jgi:hypothetical protein
MSFREFDRRSFVHLTAVAVGAAVLGGQDAASSAQTPVAGVIPDEASAFLDREATAEDLVQAWFTMLALSRAGGETATPAASGQDDPARAFVGVVLDPAFQLVRAAGERYVAETYVPVELSNFTISDVRETRPADDLVVARYAIQIEGEIAPDTSLVLSDSAEPRLSVFHWDDAAGQWKLISHANFSSPISTVCDAVPLVPEMNPPVATSADDIALGISLVDAAAEAAADGNTLPVLDPQIQVQLASGFGYTTTDERPGETKLERSEVTNFLVTRNDNVIVVSFRGVPQGEVNEIEVKRVEAPRMITFRLNEEGAWKAIATAFFSTVAEVPEGVDCTPRG